MTFNEYTRLEENLENTQDLFYAWEDVRDILKKFRGNQNFHEIYDFVENHSKFLFNAMQKAKQAVLENRYDNEGEILFWKLNRKEPLSKPINQGYDPCYEIYYEPLDELDEYIKFGAGI